MAPNLTGATVTGADFGSTRGLSNAQFYVTANYLDRNLRGITLSKTDLSGWDLSHQDLTGGRFSLATLTDARLNNADLTDVSFEFSKLFGTDLSGANIAQADFRGTTEFGLTPGQLYLTASFQANDLRGIKLWENDLSNWSFAGQDLTDADFCDPLSPTRISIRRLSPVHN